MMETNVYVKKVMHILMVFVGNVLLDLQLILLKLHVFVMIHFLTLF